MATERFPVSVLIFLVFKNLSQKGNWVKLGLNPQDVLAGCCMFLKLPHPIADTFSRGEKQNKRGLMKGFISPLQDPWEAERQENSPGRAELDLHSHH